MRIVSLMRGRKSLSLLLVSALLLPVVAGLAAVQRDRAARSAARLESLDRIESQRKVASARLQEWRDLYGRIEQLGQAAIDDRWDDRAYQARVLRVDNRSVSRREADLYLASTRPERGGFFVIDTFKVQVSDPQDSLFATHAEDDRPAAVKVLLRGQQYLKEPRP